MARNGDEILDNHSDGNRTVKDFAKALEKATLVTNTAEVSPNKEGAVLAKQLDLGMITSISGTPAKTSAQANDVNSPVIRRKPNQAIH